MEKLSELRCADYKDSAVLEEEEIRKLMEQIPDWELSRNKKQIGKEFGFEDFKTVLAFVNKVGELAEQEGHHPDILIHNWNKVRLTLSTHSAGGLTMPDLILAAKINSLSV